MARKASEKPAAKAPKTAPEKAEVKLQEAAAALTAEVKAEEKKAKAPAKRVSKPKAPKQEAPKAEKSEPKAEKPEPKAEKPVKEAKPKAKKEAKPAQKKEEKIVESKPETKPEPQAAKVEQPQPAPKAEAAPAKKKILFVTSEAAPYVKTGGLGEVAAALPKALVRKGYDVRVVLPLYFNIPGEFRRTMQYLGCCYVSLAWRYQYCGVFTHMYDGVRYYFIDNEYYFKRNGLYGHYDDAERFAYFSRAVLEALPIMDFKPDIIHCNDWQTGLTPVYLDTYYRGSDFCRTSRTVFTIHNIEFQGKYGEDIIGDIVGLPGDRRSLVTYQGCANFMKGGIECANRVTTVSPTYAKEILDPYYSFGLQDILNARRYKLSGIVNGIDNERNDPATDKALFKNYDKTTVSEKYLNKTGLQQLLGLPVKPSVAMIGMVGRLTEQKGLDLIRSVFDDILAKGIQMVVLGTGDWKYESMLKDMQRKYPEKLRAIINFSSDMASKIYAAADMFLMPSKFEPCGLSQMIAMRYGTAPIVRETGGLKDTVVPYNGSTGQGNGFTFYSYNAHDMLYAIERAVGLYYDYKDDWKKLIANAMSADFSWDRISEQYVELYDRL